MKKKPLPLWVTINGNEACDSLEKFLNEVNPFGIILFSRHLKSKNQVKDLISFAKEIDPDILFGIDQEGGRVNRLSALGYNFLGASDACEDPEIVEKISSEMAEVLHDLGFDVNFAPVVDVGKAASGTGLEGRIYSQKKEVVKECAEAFLKGLNKFGIKGCLKHFPGLGGSLVDSHKDLPLINGNLEDREEHLYPFRNLKADFVMVAHSSYEIFSSNLPSSINKDAYSLLRYFKCCDTIVTDDLSMGALKNFGTLEDLTRKSLECGTDIAMVICSEEETKKIARCLRRED